MSPRPRALLAALRDLRVEEPASMLIRIGSRGSALAVWQAEHVRQKLAALGHEAAIRVITTTGDRVQDRRLEEVGGKGAFLKEIEEAMLAGEIDLAVHSLKDVPTALPAGLRLCAVLPRADPRDALLSASGLALKRLPAGARVGTTSLRRRAQVAALRPDLVLQDLRGNVDTRSRKLREGACDAILLAVAGLERGGRRGVPHRRGFARRRLRAPARTSARCRSAAGGGRARRAAAGARGAGADAGVKSLEGRRILVTRRSEQSRSLVDALSALGATV